MHIFADYFLFLIKYHLAQTYVIRTELVPFGKVFNETGRI